MYSQSDGIPVSSGPIGSPTMTVGQPMPVMPSAPLPGYEMVTEKYTNYHAPPPYEPSTIQMPIRQFTPFYPIDLTENEVREAVRAHVKTKINYSSGAVNEMMYNRYERSIAYVYRLKTLLETRKTKAVYKPYDGSPVDGPCNGPAPHGWAIHINAPDAFVSGKSGGIPVPHTESVRPCFSCHGSGRQRCSSCSGVGSKSCTWCHGHGTRTRAGGESERCSSCHGCGRDTCSFCHGSGSKDCHTCLSRGSLKHWIQIKAHWSVHVDEFVSSSVNLKEKEFLKAAGFPILDETATIVQGLRSGEFSDDAVVAYSQSMTSKPQTNSRIIRQNQVILALPITVVDFTRKKDSGHFTVFGTDNRVHFDHYPSKNCCIC